MSQRLPPLTGWCILRTSGPRTIALETSLSAAGIDAWTPKDTTTRRKPRTKIRTIVAVPILPTFVFARADSLRRLARAMVMHNSPHPGFSIFRHDGRYPIIAEREIAGLREIEATKRREWEARLERERRAATQRPVFPVGARVNVNDGAWQGMSGVVIEDGGAGMFVSFGGNLRVKIDSWLLRPDELEARQPA